MINLMPNLEPERKNMLRTIIIPKKPNRTYKRIAKFNKRNL